MAGMLPERKTRDAIEKANRKMLEEQDKRLERWREDRLNSIEKERATPSVIEKRFASAR